jgi:hypothetical protein
LRKTASFNAGDKTAGLHLTEAALLKRALGEAAPHGALVADHQENPAISCSLSHLMKEF